MKLGLVVGGVLALSVATNIYLLVFDSIEPAESTRRPARARKVHTKPVTVAVDTVARLDRAALETRLAKAEATLAKTLPLNLKFERAEPSPESERRIQPVLDKLFDGEEYTLECRGAVCIIGSDSESDWRDRIQSDIAVVGAFGGMQVGRNVTVQLEDAPRAASINTLVRPAEALRTSPALAACKREHPAEGTLWLSLQIEARRFIVKANGPLANQAIGVCIRRALEDIAAATPMPPDVTSTEEMPFPVPLP